MQYGNVSLGDYIQKNVLDPANLTDTFYWNGAPGTQPSGLRHQMLPIPGYTADFTGNHLPPQHAEIVPDWNVGAQFILHPAVVTRTPGVGSLSLKAYMYRSWSQILVAWPSSPSPYVLSSAKCGVTDSIKQSSSRIGRSDLQVHHHHSGMITRNATLAGLVSWPSVWVLRGRCSGTQQPHVPLCGQHGRALRSVPGRSCGQKHPYSHLPV